MQPSEKHAAQVGNAAPETHTSKAGLLGRIAASYCGVPAIVHSSQGSILDGYFSPSLTSIFAQFEKFAASISDKIICLTREEIGRNLEAGIGSESQYTYIFKGSISLASNTDAETGIY